MKKDITVKVSNQRHVGAGCVLMQVIPADGSQLPEIAPGQFVNILVPDTNGVFLRRPISVCDVEDEVLTLFIKDAGKGTHTLCSMLVGDEFRVLLPLGRGFDYTDVKGKAMLVGGGVGIAPLLYLGRKLKEKGVDFEFLLGGASATDLEVLPQFESLAPVNVTTADGSLGVKGFVTDHPVLQSAADVIYTCGPTPMMKALAGVARQRGIPMQASLENHMACGLGACLCCVEDTTTGNRCVCTDGPVFSLDELRW